MPDRGANFVGGGGSTLLGKGLQLHPQVEPRNKQFRARTVCLRGRAVQRARVSS